MKVVFFGLGSIGQRHAGILQKNYQHDLWAFRSGKKEKNKLGLKELHSWSEVEKIKPDVVFITNPTFLHIKTAIKCSKLGCKLFIEKPIDKDLKGLAELLRIVKQKNLVTYVAYNLRFHPVIGELKKYIEKETPLHLRVVCTSYLPDWRPGTNHLKSYSANAKMGGGVILDLSHELDYVSWLLGGVDKISGRFSKVGGVTVDAEDNADILMQKGKVNANIHLNFMSNLRQRYVQIDFDKASVYGDLVNNQVVRYKKGKRVKMNKLKYNIAQSYEDQLKYFFVNINNPEMMNNLVEASTLFRKIAAFKKRK